MPTPVPEETLTVYAVHDFIDPLPRALFLNRDDAQELAACYPRSFIHTVEIALSRWVALQEMIPEHIGGY